jgi:hypothetical protein
MPFAGNSAEQLLAVVPLADFIIFRNYVSVTEGMQEPAQDIVRHAMADLQINYLLYFPKFIHCLFACHGMLSGHCAYSSLMTGHKPCARLDRW